MKKKIAAFFVSILAVTIWTYSVMPAKADMVGAGTWLEPTFKGRDEFYAADVTAYREGATAKLGVIVDRDGAPITTEVNITAVSVVFDWGGNYTFVPTTSFTLNDTVTQAAFTVTFTVPSTTVASNLFLHTYTIYVNYVTTMGAGTFPTVTRDAFAVHSNTQADAQLLNQQVDAYPGTWAFSSSEADVLWEKGRNAAASGDTYYKNGDFTNAVSSYQLALTLFNQAFDAEKAYQSIVDTAYTTALSNYYNALANNAGIEANASRTEAEAAMKEANAAQIEADAAITNAYGWLAFGIGWILIGLGVVIYGLRKPKPSA